MLMDNFSRSLWDYYAIFLFSGFSLMSRRLYLQWRRAALGFCRVLQPPMSLASLFLVYFRRFYDFVMIFQETVKMRYSATHMLRFSAKRFLQRQKIYASSVGVFGNRGLVFGSNPYTDDPASIFLNRYTYVLARHSGVIVNASMYLASVSLVRYARRLGLVVGSVGLYLDADYVFGNLNWEVQMEKFVFNFFFSLQKHWREPSRYFTMWVNTLVGDSDRFRNTQEDPDAADTCLLEYYYDHRKYGTVSHQTVSRTSMGIDGKRCFSTSLWARGRKLIRGVGTYLKIQFRITSYKLRVMCARLYCICIISSNGVMFGSYVVNIRIIWRHLFSALDWHSKDLWYLIDNPSRYAEFLRYFKRYAAGRVHDEAKLFQDLLLNLENENAR